MTGCHDTVRRLRNRHSTEANWRNETNTKSNWLYNGRGLLNAIIRLRASACDTSVFSRSAFSRSAFSSSQKRRLRKRRPWKRRPRKHRRGTNTKTAFARELNEFKSLSSSFLFLFEVCVFEVCVFVACVFETPDVRDMKRSAKDTLTLVKLLNGWVI